jgi:serine protease inhibitor
MTKQKNSNLSPTGRNKNKTGILIVVLILISISIIRQYLYKKEDNLLIPNTTYYKGEVYSANHAANMLDYLDKGDNIIISPINVNTSLAILYNGTDNNSNKELKKYFKKTPTEVNEEMSYKLSNLKAENELKNKTNHLYEAYIQELNKKSYNNLTISTISLLSKEQKEDLILLLKKIELSYDRLNNNKYSEKNIKEYKLTSSDLALNNYNIKELLDKIISNYESYSIINEVNNYTDIYVNNNENIDDEFTKNTSLYNYNITSLKAKKEPGKTRVIKEDLETLKSGKINRIVESQDLKPNDVIITNNLYFNYSWNIPFDQNSIKDTEFFSIDDEVQAVEMMYSNQATYLENSKAKGFKYDFENSKYSFIGILPKNDTEFKLSTLNIDSFLLSKKQGKVLIGIPKMNYQSEIDIQELVNHYNINEIFTEKANFTRISESNLSINKMIQKNNLTIAEKGTLKSNLKQQTLYNLDDDYKEQIILNRPYAYLIINNETNDILFIGKVVRINKNS